MGGSVALCLHGKCQGRVCITITSQFLEPPFPPWLPAPTELKGTPGPPSVPVTPASPTGLLFSQACYLGRSQESQGTKKATGTLCLFYTGSNESLLSY